MKKVLLSMIVAMFMIMGLSSDTRAQSDSVSTWTINKACFHDSQDVHLYDVDVPEPFVLTINTESNVITLDDPQRSREYTLTGPTGTRRSTIAKQFRFDAVDEKAVECKVSVIFYMEGGLMKISLSVKYPNMIMYWSGTFIEEERKIQT